jgi:hypothetical protein
LSTGFDTGGIELAAHNLVSKTDVFSTTAGKQNYGVLLEIVTDAGDVSRNFKTI